MAQTPNTIDTILGNLERPINSECWEWQSPTSTPYAKTTINNRTVSVHKFVYEQLVGPVPEGLQLDHICRNKICANPVHLEPVTCIGMMGSFISGAGNVAG